MSEELREEVEDPDRAFIEAICDRLLEKMTGYRPEVEERKGKKETHVKWSHQLAIKKNLWLQIAAFLGFSGLITVGGWWLWVRDGIKDSATKEYVAAESKSAVATHESMGAHPRMEKELEKLSQKQEEVKVIQIKQTQILENQHLMINDIKEDIDQIQKDQNRIIRKMNDD